MNMLSDSIGSPSGSRRIYILLLAVQSIGALIICCKILPLYRELVGTPLAYEVQRETQVWALLGVVLVQVGYWVCYRAHPARSILGNVLLGHVVDFVSRLMFVLASSVFSLVFITKKLADRMPFGAYILTMLALFSLFCYMLELQRLALALQGQEDPPMPEMGMSHKYRRADQSNSDPCHVVPVDQKRRHYHERRKKPTD